MALQVIVKSAEVRLQQMLNEIRTNASTWQAIHFHLSELLEEYKSEYQSKIAINLIHDLLKTHEGSIFLINDDSIVVMCMRLEQTLQEKLIFQLRYLYMDDPLAYTDTGQENVEFCTVYDLRRQWQNFSELSSKLMTNFTRRQAATGPLMMEKPVEPPSQQQRAENYPVLERSERAPKSEADLSSSGLSASKLATIERDLNYTDLMKVLRRQPVCAILPDMKVRRVFDELYIHIAHLRQMMKSDVDFLSNRWLFKYLTHVLDERMLELIGANPNRYLNTPVSLNLNVETLLSSQFTAFDAKLNPSVKVSIVIEVPVIDVFADMAAFTIARTEVQKLGYRVCLDGLTTASFASISREKLGLDLVKVQWNSDLQGDLKSAENRALIEAVQATGNNRIILCRCDNRSAVEYGQALGISLFQGRYIDNVLNPTAKVEN